MDTDDLFRRIAVHRESLPALVATGGIVDIGSVVDLMAAGASAMQVTSAIDLYGIHVLTLFRDQTRTILNELNVDSWSAACAAVRDSAKRYRELLISVRRM